MGYKEDFLCDNCGNGFPIENSGESFVFNIEIKTPGKMLVNEYYCKECTRKLYEYINEKFLLRGNEVVKLLFKDDPSHSIAYKRIDLKEKGAD